MTYLFHLIEPGKKLRITKKTIAKLLNLPLHLIVRVECWTYVIFIHRQDRGGQFISYRRLRQWRNAVASQIQKCQTLSQLNSLWIAIELDWHRYSAQYSDKYLKFVRQIWNKTFASLSQSGSSGLKAIYSPVTPRETATIN